MSDWDFKRFAWYRVDLKHKESGEIWRLSDIAFNDYIKAAEAGVSNEALTAIVQCLGKKEEENE